MGTQGSAYPLPMSQYAPVGPVRVSAAQPQYDDIATPAPAQAQPDYAEPVQRGYETIDRGYDDIVQGGGYQQVNSGYHTLDGTYAAVNRPYEEPSPYTLASGDYIDAGSISYERAAPGHGPDHEDNEA